MELPEDVPGNKFRCVNVVRCAENAFRPSGIDAIQVTLITGVTFSPPHKKLSVDS